MWTVNCRNVNEALPMGVHLLRTHGIQEDSRNGPVLRAPWPVTTVYERPWERVLFHQPERDANPFFHLVESLWMLAGRNTLKDLTPYVSRMAEFSDDGGKTQPGAYGHRWRHHFARTHTLGGSTNFDQLNWAVGRLRKDPNDRRVVIQMWDASHDPMAADRGSRDVPCNLTMLPWVSEGKLHLTVFCRSNDIVWGAYGANAVHFSMTQEYLAARVGVPMGMMWQISNNYHGYLSTLPERIADKSDPYQREHVASFPLAPINEKHLQEDLAIFFDHGPFEAVTAARWPYLRQVAVPMALAHQHWRTNRGPGRYTEALEILDQCRASDWRLAGRQWLERRQAAAERARDDGVMHDC